MHKAHSHPGHQQLCIQEESNTLVHRWSSVTRLHTSLYSHVANSSSPLFDFKMGNNLMAKSLGSQWLDILQIHGKLLWLFCKFHWPHLCDPSCWADPVILLRHLLWLLSYLAVNRIHFQLRSWASQEVFGSHLKAYRNLDFRMVLPHLLLLCRLQEYFGVPYRCNYGSIWSLCTWR